MTGRLKLVLENHCAQGLQPCHVASLGPVSSCCGARNPHWTQNSLPPLIGLAFSVREYLCKILLAKSRCKLPSSCAQSWWYGSMFFGSKKNQAIWFSRPPGLKGRTTYASPRCPSIPPRLLYRSSQQFQLIQTISNKCSQCFPSKYPSLLSMWVDPKQNLAAKTLRKLCWHRTGPGQQEKEHVFTGGSIMQNKRASWTASSLRPLWPMSKKLNATEGTSKKLADSAKPFLFWNPLPRAPSLPAVASQSFLV